MREGPPPLVLAFSTSRLRRVFESVAPLVARTAEVRVFDKGFEEALQVVRDLSEAGERPGALVSAGANGAYLRDHAEVPVVVLGASTVDALQSVVQARRLSPRIGIVNFVRRIEGIEAAQDLFGETVIDQRPYVSPEEARAHVADLAARGFPVIIGPGPVCDLAERAGLRAVLLYGQDSVKLAIREAADIARIARAESERGDRLRRVLDHLEVAVAAVDPSERVETVNPAMLRLLGLPAAQVTGRRLSTLAPELGLGRVLDGGPAELDGDARIAGRPQVVSRVPLRARGALVGALVTCQDAAALQRSEQRIRSRHRPRRFEARYALPDILGDSPAIRAVRDLAGRYARTDATVLVTGESGTGKEMVAQGIHAASPRRGGPFVALNCAAFPETLLEAELFGYEEGAFTGARRGGRAGLFEAAHLGTIFLDEVGDVPLTLQSRLLRVLQERQVLRLGSTEPTPVDVRVVAATNRDLRAMVAEGRFREDLFFRLHILPVHVPPLRERPGDLAAIARELLRRALARHGAAAEEERAGAAVLPRLAAYRWPGNVRELENVIERIAVLFADGTPPASRLDEVLALAMPELSPAGAAPPPAARMREARAERDRAHAEEVLHECGGNVSEAARRLGVGRSTLYRMLGPGAGRAARSGG